VAEFSDALPPCIGNAKLCTQLPLRRRPRRNRDSVVYSVSSFVSAPLMCAYNLNLRSRQSR